ncbi:unnamed protein product, partial [marine sediment metagenome]
MLSDHDYLSIVPLCDRASLSKSLQLLIDNAYPLGVFPISPPELIIHGLHESRVAALKELLQARRMEDALCVTPDPGLLLQLAADGLSAAGFKAPPSAFDPETPAIDARVGLLTKYLLAPLEESVFRDLMLLVLDEIRDYLRLSLWADIYRQDGCSGNRPRLFLLRTQSGAFFDTRIPSWDAVCKTPPSRQERSSRDGRFLPESQLSRLAAVWRRLGSSQTTG